MTGLTNKIAAVVVTYNRLPMLQKCINALLRQTADSFDIFIIDNASTDGTGDYCASIANNKRIVYYNTGKNLGGAGGFSYGIRAGTEAGYDYLWLMDDDTIPQENALKELLIAADNLNNNFGFLSSLALWTDNTPCKMNTPGVADSWWVDVDSMFENNLLRINYASFVSLFLKAAVVEELGLPIKEFFIWTDDYEYTTRISKKYPCYFVYNSKVIHEMNMNSGTSIMNDREDRLDRYRYLYRNRYYIARNNRKKDQVNYFIDIKNTIKALLLSDKPDKYKRIRIVISSYLSGVCFKPKIEYVSMPAEAQESNTRHGQ